jgi:hypothetical protein
LFYLVVTEDVFDEPEIPVGWGTLVEAGGSLVLIRKPVWQNVATEHSLRMLHRIAAAGTRHLNRQSGITFEDVISARSQQLSA